MPETTTVTTTTTTQTPFDPSDIISEAAFKATFQQDSAFVTAELQQVRRVFHRLANQDNDFQPIDLTLVASSMHRLIAKSSGPEFALRQSPLAMMRYVNLLVHLYSNMAHVAICVRPALITEFAEDMTTLKALSVGMIPLFTEGQVKKALAIKSLEDRFYGNDASYYDYMFGHRLHDCNQQLMSSAERLVRQVVREWSQVDVTSLLQVNVTEFCAGSQLLEFQELAEDDMGSSGATILIIVISVLVLVFIVLGSAVAYLSGMVNWTSEVNQNKMSTKRKVKHSSKSSEKTSSSYTIVRHRLLAVPMTDCPGDQDVIEWSDLEAHSAGKISFPDKGNLLAVTDGPSGRALYHHGNR
ncbi:hypothetical protein HDE_05869 [Halotydeus destructor]|nr:hypothetical protein HDE_05869 [Halotydeus destructor]